MPDNFTFTAGDAIVTRYLTGTEIGQIVTQQVSTEYTFEFHGGHTTGYPIYIRPNGNTDGSNPQDRHPQQGGDGLQHHPEDRELGQAHGIAEPDDADRDPQHHPHRLASVAEPGQPLLDQQPGSRSRSRARGGPEHHPLFLHGLWRHCAPVARRDHEETEEGCLRHLLHLPVAE